MTKLYLDHAAATPVRPIALAALQTWLGPAGNPASGHWAGRQARRALEDARERVATLLGATPPTVVFTSGATEANNLALFGLAGPAPGHLIGSTVEHPCVERPLAELAQRGFAVDPLPVDAEGVVVVDALAGLVRPDTRMVACQLVNHETGAIQPVERLSGPYHLHCDAAQAVGKIPVNYGRMNGATLALSGHKFGAPAGIGVLLVARCTRLMPQLFGGHQQAGRRPGTEPVALAVAFAAALAEAEAERETVAVRLAAARALFVKRLQAEASPVFVNGSANGVPHILNLSFPGCVSEGLIAALDLAGIAVSAGAACSSGSLLPSPVLRAMRLPDDRLRSAVRFSFGAETTHEQLDDAVGRVIRVVSRLRQ